MSNVLDSIVGTQIQDEFGTKYIVNGHRDVVGEIYISLESTLGSQYYVSLDRYDQLCSLPINNPKSWDEMAGVPYEITAGVTKGIY